MPGDKKASRRARKGALTKEINYIKIAIAEDDTKDVADRLKRVKEKFSAFEEVHDSYHEELADEADIEASEKFYLDVQENYAAAVLETSKWLKSQSIPKEKIEVKVVNEKQDELSRVELLGLINMPKLELEVFSGDPLEFHHFSAVFDEHVDNAAVEPGVKLTRLLQCTSGKAKDSIRACSLIGGERGYTEARAILKKRFGDSHLICDSVIKSLRMGKPVKSSEDLQQLADELMTSYAILSSLQRLSEIDTQSSIIDVLGRLQPYLKNRWKREALQYKREKAAYPDFRLFMEFILREAEEATDPVYGSISGKRSQDLHKFASSQKGGNFSSHDQKGKSSNSTVFTARTSQRKQPACLSCSGEHRLFNCDKFRAMKPSERLTFVNSHKLCENCLLANHVTSDCRKPSVCSVPGCGEKHTKFIHVDHRSSQDSTISSESSMGMPNVNQVEVNAQCNTIVKIHLPTVKVTVNDKVTTSALLDTGSTSTFCTQQLVDALGIRGSSASYVLNTLSASQEKCQSELVDLDLMSSDGENFLKLTNVYVVKNIPVRKCDKSVFNFAHLHDLPIHDCSQVDLLIGQDHSDALIPLQTRRGAKGEPFAVRTILGWSVNGPVCTSGPVSRNAVSHFVTTSNFDENLKKLWDVESDNFKVENPSWSHEDKQVIKLWDESIQLVNGHYQLPIPWKPDVKMVNNVSQAMTRLKSTCISLDKRGLRDRYDGEINKLLSKGYAEVIPDDQMFNDNRIWYLPHHAVLNPKKPDKLRIVFDCAAKYMNQSLNDRCFQGPDLNNKLAHVLLRFRQHPVGVMADIESMYHQIKIPEYDRDSLRFLWHDAEGKVVHCRMTSHLFGGVWCASSSTYALRRLLYDINGVDQVVKDIVLSSFYVDDCLMSFPDKHEAVSAMEDTRKLLTEGGFRLTKFVSNDPDVISSIPKSERSSEVKDLSFQALSKVLGVKWDLAADEFYFEVDSVPCEVVTKRRMLSFVSSIFDPLGFVNPVVVSGRLLFQEAVRLKMSWDEPVSGDLLRKWLQWTSELHHLSTFKIPRCVKPSDFNDSALQLHHFSDASLQSYGFCSYIRAVNKSGCVLVELLMSKCRVTPLKSISVPRLELQAALMAARADTLLHEILSFPIVESFFWTDSDIVLHYIKNESLRFQIFVGNRVSEIRQLTDPSQWFHVSGKENPADLVTRGESSLSMDTHKWLHGPKFLSLYRNEWQVDSPCVETSDDDPEIKCSNPVVASCAAVVPEHPLDVLISHFSSWYKLKRAVAWWRRIIAKLKVGVRLDSKMSLTVTEIDQAEKSIVKHVQSQSYAKELHKLVAGNPVGHSSPVRDLVPVLNDDGIVCVGGRLKYAPVGNDRKKHPYLLPYDHLVSVLIARDIHDSAHLGVEWVLSLLRSKFWIVKARSLIKKIQRNCVTCRKLFAQPCSQQMADLPPERLDPGKPCFSYVGLDCFGPFYVKVSRSDVKRYGCIFTCLATRAVHLEVLYGLDVQAFLNGFRRFVSRRGKPLKLWSDNGTNLTGAFNELSRLDQFKITSYSVKQGIEWSFNPPHASHMGGIWERLIRTVRKVISGLLGTQCRLTDDVLHTLFAEVESLINSRPITKVSDSAKDPDALTPNHLLMMSGGPPPPPGVFAEHDMFRKRWKYVQFLADQFWRRWLRQYIPDLQKRQKWVNQQTNVKVNDLVLICDENTPRGLWPLGIVIETKMGRDGLVRSVKVKTKSSEFTRPVTKIVLIEGE